MGNNMRKTWKSILTLSLTLSMCTAPLSSISTYSTVQAAVTKKDTTYRTTKEANPEITMNNRPESPYWFPKDLLKWNGESDVNLPLYKGNIPLKSRVDKKKLNPVNKTQLKEFQVAALSIMNANTSGNSPHGLNKFDANTFSYWQYVDTFVYWGGSSGEGLIVPPSADVIDAAHTNGVPVLGTVFFPMAEHGGKIQWLNDFLVKDADGNFPMVDKLVETAKLLGFDGWFINQETQGTKEAPLTKKHAELMKEFVYDLKKAAGNSLTIFWYDSMTKDGKMDWQNALTDKNSCYLIDDKKEKGADYMFLNFWWSGVEKKLLENSKKKAESLSINPYDLFAGIDVQANGTNTKVDWNAFAKNNVPYTSLGLYCPSWAYFAADSLADYEKKENRLWVNEKGNPAAASKVSDSQWHGVSNYAVEKTVVDSLPFITNFNLGNGYSYFIDGEKVSSLDWNNRSMTSVMPTYRWIINQSKGNTLKPSFDYYNAYYGGNSIELYGKMAKDEHSSIKLYSASLPITEKTTAAIYAKASHNTDVKLMLTLEDGSKKEISSTKGLDSDWTKVSFDLSSIKGKTVTSIGLDFSLTENDSTVQINLGRMEFIENASSFVGSADGIAATDYQFDEDNMYAGVKLNWKPADNAAFYEIYKTYADGSKSFLGATTASAHYIHALEREKNEDVTTFEVVPVNQYLKRGTGSKTTMNWPNNRTPKADFKASKTLAAPGEKITFESLSSLNTEEVEWTFEGADITSSKEKNPTITYSKEGTYNVTLVARNQEGSAEKSVTGMIQIDKAAGGELPILSQGAAVTASSFVNENEAPKFALDGKTDTKWCATGPAPHDITIDLGSEQIVSEVYIAHAEKGNESPDMNTKWYSIETSIDGKNFELAAEVKKNKAKETVDTFKPVKARYIKVSIIKPTQGADTAARIYEIQVKGIKK